jgi:hypothetical protein
MLGDGEEVGAGLAPVWARSGEQSATAATNKTIRIITKILRGLSRGRRGNEGFHNRNLDIGGAKEIAMSIEQRLLLTANLAFGQC